MKYGQIKKTCGYILLIISFFFYEIYDVLLKGTGSVLFESAFFILFVTGLLLKSEKKHQWGIQTGYACFLTAVAVLSDFVLKWIMTNTISLSALMDAWHPLSGDIPCFVLIWFSVFLYQKEEQPVSFAGASFRTIGDSMTILLLSHLFVSNLPSYWNNSHHPFFWHLFYDFLITVFVMIMLATDGRESKHLFHEYRNSEVFRKFSDGLSWLNAKTKKLQTVLYFIVFGYLYFYYFLNTTTFPAYLDLKIPGLTAMLVKGSLMMLLIGRLLAVFAMYDADQKWEKLWIRITLIFGIIFYGQSQFGALFNFMMLLCAGVKKDAGTMLKEAFGIGISMMLISWLCASKGIISDVVVENRHGLGIIYATDCYAHWFYLFAIYCLIRKGKFRWYEYLITLILNLYLYKLTDADTNLICIGLLWMFMLLHQCLFLHFRDHHLKISNLFIGSFCFFAAVYFIAVRNIEKLDSFLQQHFYTLWLRLYYGQMGLKKYSLRFLFQTIEEHGNGNMDYTQHTFFYLDVSYIRILLMYGILMFLFIMVLMTWFMVRAEKEKQGLLFAILCIIALQSAVEQRLPDFWYNIFLIMPLMNLSSLSDSNNGRISEDKRETKDEKIPT